MKDYFGYQGQVCVVTGAASGMGKATAEMLVDLGAIVYALDVADVPLQGVKQFIKANVGEKASIDAAFSQLPSEIDKFFGIAGVSGMKTDYNTTVKINYIGNKYITEEYLLKRVKSGGAIAYITSSGGLGWDNAANREELKILIEPKGFEQTLAALESLNLNANPGPMGYVLSKRVMNLYAATIVPLFGEKKIRVNCVLPGQTQTGLTGDFVAMRGGMDKAVESTGFVKRLADAREMAEPLVFLNSGMASYISGVMLDGDFGIHAMVKTGVIPDRMNFKLLSK